MNPALRELPALAIKNKILIQRGGNLFAATSGVAPPNPSADGRYGDSEIVRLDTDAA